MHGCIRGEVARERMVAVRGPAGPGVGLVSPVRLVSPGPGVAGVPLWDWCPLAESSARVRCGGAGPAQVECVVTCTDVDGRQARTQLRRVEEAAGRLASPQEVRGWGGRVDSARRRNCAIANGRCVLG